MTKIYIASDHGGQVLRPEIFEYLKSLGHDVEDLSGENTPEDDYPDFAHKVGEAVSNESGSIGILLCGSGVGMCIAANKHKNVRATVVHNASEAFFARRDDDINVLCLAGKNLPSLVNGQPGSDRASEVKRIADVKNIIDIFLTTEFPLGGRFERRRNKVEIN